MTPSLRPCESTDHVENLDAPADDDLAALIAAVEADAEINERSVSRRPCLDAEVPADLAAYVNTITSSEWVAQLVILRAAERVLRRLRHETPESRRARWAKRWRPEEQAQTKRWLSRIRDEVVRAAHFGRVACHAMFPSLPRSLEPWHPDENGMLIIDEPSKSDPSFGSPGYLEQTPVKLLRWVHETWLGQSLDIHGRRLPRLWDLTAGSGTAADYFGNLLGCGILSSDVVVVLQAGEALGDCRCVETLHQHRGTRTGFSRPDVVVRTPDIILFDPPSRGTPAHSQIYGEPVAEDLAFLEREQWIVTVADVAAQAANLLADRGFLSLLLRCGARFHGEVIYDADLLGDFKTVFGNRGLIAHEMPLRYRSVRNQTSLGSSRVPAVHLKIERAL